MTGGLTSALVAEGGFIYLARLSGALSALKDHRSSERLHRVFRQELEMLLRIRHPAAVDPSADRNGDVAADAYPKPVERQEVLLRPRYESSGFNAGARQRREQARRFDEATRLASMPISALAMSTRAAGSFPLAPGTDGSTT